MPTKTEQVGMSAMIGNRHETKNYVRFTGHQQFARGGARITVYLDRDEDAQLGSPQAITMNLEPIQ